MASISSRLTAEANAETPTSPPVPLNRLAAGQAGVVHQVVGKPEQVRRLAELGFSAGVPVEIVQAGSPCIVRLGARRLCFRAAEVLGILVQVGAVS